MIIVLSKQSVILMHHIFLPLIFMKTILAFIIYFLLALAAIPSACVSAFSCNSACSEYNLNAPHAPVIHACFTDIPAKNTTKEKAQISSAGIRNSPRRTNSSSPGPYALGRHFNLQLTDINRHPAIHLPHCCPEHIDLCNLCAVALLI
jgi:hypothetical protein